MLDKFFNLIEKLIPKKWRWILNHGGFRRYLTNTGWMVFGNIFSLILSFLVGAWVIRYLGPEEYGILSYVLAFVGIFAFIASLGITSILQRELVNHPEKRDSILGTAFILRLGGGALAFLISVFIIFLLESSTLIKLLVLIQAFSLIFYSSEVITLFFASRVESKKSVQASILSGTISSLLKVILILSGAGIIWMMVVFVLDGFWLSVFLFLAYKRSGLKIRDWRFNKPLAKSILSSSWLLALTSASVLIYMRIDQVMIKRMIDAEAVGLYASSVKIFEFTYIIPSLITFSLFPAILNALKVSYTAYRRRLRHMVALLLILSILVAGTITILSKPIILILFGPDYLESLNVLRIGVWSLLAVSLSYLVDKSLVAENRIKFYFIITLLGAIVNVVLNYLLIPIYGINGAAVSTIISYSLVAVLGLGVKKRKLAN